ncbi:MAG: BamA/TamA family outer membrane protein [Myxococcales bacterium]|nr:BamA/TamA family outer membrane protein [Myxococcales bacterium]
MLLQLASGARAQLTAELAGRAIEEVEIAGETAAIATATDVGIFPGERLRRGMIRDAIARLVATGRWADVQIDALPQGQGVKLLVHLTPRVELLRVQVNGHREVDEQVTRDALHLGRGSEVSPQQLGKLEQAVRDAYAERGYLGASVRIVLRDTDDPSSKVLMVAIEEGKATRIVSIDFAGQRPLDAYAARAAMETGIGDILDRRALAEDAARVEAHLRGRGYYEAQVGKPSVVIDGAEARVSLPTHVGRHYEVGIGGHSPLQRGEVFDAMKLLDEPLSATSVQKTLPRRVQELYASYGFGDCKVRVDALRLPRPGRALLRVDIDPGPQLEVVTVAFPGARQFDREFLRDQLEAHLSERLPGSTFAAPVDSETADVALHGESPRAMRQVPHPPRTNPARVYDPKLYNEAIEHITDLYQAEGYLSARLGPMRLRRVGSQRAAVIIPVTEGPRTLIYRVRLRGTRALGQRELLGHAGLVRGEPFSYLGLEEARRRIVETYRERGYFFVKAEPTVRFSRDRTRAEVDVQIVERYPVHVDRVDIRGAERTDPGLIRQVLKLEPGDVYRPSQARESERALANLGVFTGVSVTLQEPELPARAKSVVVTVSERRNQFLNFGAGISTGQGLRSGFEYGYRNLFGHAVGLSLRVQFAYQLFFVDPVFEERFRQLDAVDDQLERRISLGTSIPHTPGLGPVRTSVDLVHLRDNERDFGLDKNGVGLTFSYSPVQSLSLTFGGDLENNNVDLFVGQALDEYLKGVTNTRLLRLLRVPEGSSTLVAARSSISYDRRDSAFTPTRGYFVTTSAELARTLSSDVSRFLKLSATGNIYLPVYGEWITALQARTGRIIHLTDTSKTYPNRAFYLGGIDTMRGYLEDSLMPQDVAEEVLDDPELLPNSVVRAGDAFVLFRGELRFPLYGQLRGGIFSDVGNLWADPARRDLLALRPTAGVGLRLATPVGPIALDYGFNLARRRGLGERSGALHFSVGLF